MLDAKTEVARLIDQLFAEAAKRHLTAQDICDTVEIAAIVRQIALPTLADDTPPSFVPALARATLLGAFIQHDINQRGHARPKAA